MIARFRSFNFSPRSQATVAATVVLLVLCLLPFASALEVHHIFAEVDHDGHEHSDFDLCQWVQAHGSGSVDLDHGNLGIPLQVEHEQWHTSEIVFSSKALTSQESRGPPLFL
ncbi:hypothetical protein [Candidatus Nitronereus thalassa]|uniref:Uncharacterized protein n=1 Tax=Candidatus Nitronereus thalassa TaxID=3020898 RepID=A0ABU3KBY7_9BACT|nr:hypothetical protein [Candidatus Nitronereus thalassa]MDT7043935.1 hypothetical protein [Candidatus Nitronereus thalassa]